MDFPDEDKMKTKTSGSTKEDRSCGGLFPLCNVMKKYCAKNTGNRLSVVWDRKQWPKSRSRHQVKRPRLRPCLCHLLKPKTKTTRSVSKVDSLGKHQMSSIPLFPLWVLDFDFTSEEWLCYEAMLCYVMNVIQCLWCILVYSMHFILHGRTRVYV